MLKRLLIGYLIIAAFAMSAVELVKGNRPAAKIYLEALDKSDVAFHKLPVPQQKERMLAMAVSDLNYHFKKMSGTELEIIITSDPTQIKIPAIVIGSLANRLGAQPDGKSEFGEIFRLKIVDGMCLIGGESPAASAYGVYELLSHLGCDWVMPGINGEVIPERNDVSIGKLDIEQGPSFAVRCQWYSGGVRIVTNKDIEEFDKWKLRHKEQISREWHPLLMSSGAHVWGDLVEKYKKQFDKNPEMLAWVRQPGGTMKRQGPQVESTNPEVVNIFVEYIRDIFKKNNWPNDKRVCLGVGPADGGGFSQSPESISAGAGRIDPMTGDTDVTDLQILLCNQLIKRLEPEFPNLYLGFYLYNNHADYPMCYTPDKKVVIAIADITYSRFHGLQDRNSKTRTYYREIMEQWETLHRKQGNNLFFRSYNWNLAENIMPYSKLKIWGEDIPYYKKMGVIGCYTECSKAWSVTGPADYLEAKLIWNAALDWKKVLAEYCKNAFGKGAPFLEKYYLTLTERQSKSGQEAGSYYAFALIYDNNFIEEAFALFDSAEKAAEKPSERQRVKFARIPVEMLKYYLDFRKAYSSFDFTAAQQKIEFMKNELWRYYNIDSNLVCKNGIGYLDRFYGKFIEDSVKYSTGKYRIIYQLPDRLKLSFDLSNRGQSMGFFNPGINDSNYISAATFSSNWDAQGLSGYYSGSVWYRVPFDLPADLQEQPLGLFIGGVDSIVRIWCNGKYIGMGQGYSRPFLFDLTGLTGLGKNMLVIQVQRFGFSEIGTGGLMYPSFIFTGPRLESRAPKMEKLERMLPGGERAPTK